MVKELSRGLAAPTTDHWAKLKHLLRYLGGAQGYVQEICAKLRLSEKHSSLDVRTYVDSDWPAILTRGTPLRKVLLTCWE